MLKFAIAICSVLPRGLLVFIYDAIRPFSQKIFIGIRYCIVKSLCASAGTKIIVGTNVTFKNWNSIVIGSNVSIHDSCYIEGYGGIIIGSDVSIAHHCSLLSSSHTWDNHDLAIRLNPVQKRPLKINSNVWLGCGVRVLGGVTVNDNVIIGAGGVVTKSLAANGIYVGNPIKYYKQVYPQHAGVEQQVSAYE
ncbi:acyltransferase [Mucilaginibacter defluvii]|uniref:Acyltransferase n=1 Tax=Mucilaginibacter defluvii TaxID=1196019 RepID=A0ABP9FSY2_9SPHI